MTEEQVANFPEQFRRIAARSRELWPLVPARRKWEFAGALGIMSLTSASNPVVALLLGNIIDQLQAGVLHASSRTEMYAAVAKILGGICVIYLLRELLNVVRRFLMEDGCTSLQRDMQQRLVEHLLKTELAALSGEMIGALHGKILRSIDGFINFIRLIGLDCAPAFLTGVIALSVAVAKQPLLGLVMLGVIPISLWLTVRQLISQHGVRLALLKDSEEIDGIVVEQLNGTEYIRAANTIGIEMNRLGRAVEKRRRREIWHHFQMSLFGCAKALNEGLFHVIVLGLATYLAINQQLSYGDILTFSVLFLNVMSPLNEIHRVIDGGQESSLRVGELLEILRMPISPGFDVEDETPISLNFGEPAIEIDDLILDYTSPDGTPKRTLNGVSLRIHHGQTIGVAGPSGAGKTTWIKALLRLVRPTSGSIRIGSTPLERISHEELARNIAYVGQNPFVFSGTVRDNILYGNDPVKAELLDHAVELASLHQEISEMPGGFETHIHELGNNVSGGQRQRLAIARILLKNAPILILDEATSALDNITERHVQNGLGIRKGSHTTIIIAHRLSTLQDCDQILVFDHGSLVEQGDYHALIQQNGLFAMLVANGEGALVAT